MPECQKDYSDPMDDTIRAVLYLLRAGESALDAMKNLGLHLEGYYEQMNRLDAAISKDIQLLEEVKRWKERLGGLESMTYEIDALASLSIDTAHKLHQLHMALDKIITTLEKRNEQHR